ncbi:MAG: hypothetical protein JW891_01215 [Candidatus Lokiarchaeota archaeon]|nr:hypothetical protein [Candidatus Lokiarchaeota archaeon]
MAGRKMIVRFQNTNDSLEDTIKFLEDVKKKINYINLTVIIEGKEVKITLHGTRDLQYLARERLEELAEKYLLTHN